MTAIFIKSFVIHKGFTLSVFCHIKLCLVIVWLKNSLYEIELGTFRFYEIDVFFLLIPKLKLEQNKQNP